MTNLEGTIQNALDDPIERRSEIKIMIDNEIYSLEITGGIDKFRDYLGPNQMIRLKGTLDKDNMEINDPSDIWVKIK